MLNFLPRELKNKILSLSKPIYEVRVRVGKEVSVKHYSDNVVRVTRLGGLVSNKEIEDIVFALSNYSIYSIEESLKMGFITSPNGERVGVCGECVKVANEMETVKNFTSLCIRFPNEVIGCSSEVVKNFSSPQSVLVVSKPFDGKTTFIRDVGREYSDRFDRNVLFIDERNELSGNGRFNLGKNSDVLKFSTKKFGFEFGVRAYNPDVIICDEIMTKSDCEGVEFALNSGVKVVASVHACNMENILKKQNISKIIKNNLFEKIIFLDKFKVVKVCEV